MTPLQPYIKSLISAIKKYYQQPLCTTADFQTLSKSIEAQTKEHISAAELEQIWHYEVPRRGLLDTLARYIGRCDFDELCDWLINYDFSGENYFTPYQMSAAELAIGTWIEIKWEPACHIFLSYLGESRFKVEINKGSELHEGDEFVVSTFITNYPLFVPAIIRKGEFLPPIVCGKKGGLTSVSISSL